MLSWVSPWMLRSARCTRKGQSGMTGHSDFLSTILHQEVKTMKLWASAQRCFSAAQVQNCSGVIILCTSDPFDIKCSHVIHYLESTRQGTSKKSSSSGVNETGRQCRWLGLSEPTKQQDTELNHHCSKVRCFLYMHNSLNCKPVISIKCDCDIPINW